MLFGAHESIQGGVVQALVRGRVDGCQAIQIFTKNANTWRASALQAQEIETFRAMHQEGGGIPLMAHTSYLINLASDQPDKLARSKEALICEVLRASQLGIDFVVLHPGAHLGLGIEQGIARIAESLDEVHMRTQGAHARILIENTAGQGSALGCTFEEIASIFEQTQTRERLGACLDTQHAFAAGYNWTNQEGYESIFVQFNRHVGLDRLCAFHLNDSKKPLGSRVDRHAHLGQGHIGLELFWRLANDPRFEHTPAVLETEPREGNTPFKEEIELLHSLVGRKNPPVSWPAGLFG